MSLVRNFFDTLLLSNYNNTSIRYFNKLKDLLDNEEHIKRYNELKEKLFNEDFKAESLEQNEEIKEFLRTLIKYNTERLTIEDIFYLEDNFLEYIFNSSYVNDIDFFIFLYNTLKDKLDMSIVNPTTIRDCKFVDSILHLKLKEINLTNEQKENFKNILLDLIDKNNLKPIEKYIMSIVFYLKDIDLLQQLIQKGYRIKPDMLNRFFNIFKEVPIEDIENDKHFIKQVLNIVSKYNIQIIDENLVKIFSQLNVELVKDIIPDLIKLYPQNFSKVVLEKLKFYSLYNCNMFLFNYLNDELHVEDYKVYKDRFDTDFIIKKCVNVNLGVQYNDKELAENIRMFIDKTFLEKYKQGSIDYEKAMEYLKIFYERINNLYEDKKKMAEINYTFLLKYNEIYSKDKYNEGYLELKAFEVIELYDGNKEMLNKILDELLKTDNYKNLDNIFTIHKTVKFIGDQGINKLKNIYNEVYSKIDKNKNKKEILRYLKDSFLYNFKYAEISNTKNLDAIYTICSSFDFKHPIFTNVYDELNSNEKLNSLKKLSNKNLIKLLSILDFRNIVYKLPEVKETIKLKGNKEIINYFEEQLLKEEVINSMVETILDRFNKDKETYSKYAPKYALLAINNILDNLNLNSSNMRKLLDTIIQIEPYINEKNGKAILDDLKVKILSKSVEKKIKKEKEKEAEFDLL